MGVLGEFFHILFSCIAKLRHDELSIFLITLIVGILLGGGSWVLCSYYSRLWNLRYRVTLTLHLLCGIAALLTIIFTLAFVSLKYTKEISYGIIDSWQQVIRSDLSWGNKTWLKSYEKVKALGVEDFSRYPPPCEAGTAIPLVNQESRKTDATVFVTEAVQHFKHSHPYLALILRAQPGISIQVIREDMDLFFAAHSGGAYSTGQTIDLAAKHIKSGLDAQVPRVVTISRLLIVSLFLLVQGIPLGLIGLAAYRDVQVITYGRRKCSCRTI